MKAYLVEVYRNGDVLPETEIVRTQEEATALVRATLPGYDPDASPLGILVNTPSGMVRVSEGELTEPPETPAP